MCMIGYDSMRCGNGNHRNDPSADYADYTDSNKQVSSPISGLIQSVKSA